MSALTDINPDPSIPGHPSCDQGKKTQQAARPHTCLPQYVCTKKDVAHRHRMGRHDRRAYPDLNQGPADLQPAPLTIELCTHVDKLEMLGCLPLCARSSHGSAIWAARHVRLSGARRKAFWGRLGWFGVSLGAARAPIQQSAWRPWKPVCHGLQPECWMARLALT